MMRLRRRAGAVTTALAVLAAVALLGAGMATASPATTTACPPGQPAPSCLQGHVILWNPAGDPNATELTVEDGYGAPMAWVNLYGLYSGGDGGKDPGGLVCVTYGVQSDAACLTPRGTLTLQPTGPDGPAGAPQTLTAGDVALLHAMRAAGITPRDLRMLGRWLHATGR